MKAPKTSAAKATAPTTSATPHATRSAIIQNIEEIRGGRLLMSYITSTRPGLDVQIQDDILPMMYDCLEAGKKRAAKGVDLFIHSNGGSGTAPWRIVNLIREYTKDFQVLVPHHAFSAATLIALGADKIVMHKMGCLGPIDPTVTNPFNPPNPQNPGQRIPISVEDVSAYFTFIREDVGIHHEDELIQAVLALTQQIHPLALGNVQRSHHQSRMIAKKLLRKHIPETDREHEIDTIIENLKSNLYFHGHPINRTEARSDLKLKVEDASGDLENWMWSLYTEYSNSLALTESFIPAYEWEKGQSLTPPATPGPADSLAKIQQAGELTEEQVQKITPLLQPLLAAAAQPKNNQKVRIERLKGAYLETVERAFAWACNLTFERTQFMSPAGPQDLLRAEQGWQGWLSET